MVDCGSKRIVYKRAAVGRVFRIGRYATVIHYGGYSLGLSLCVFTAVIIEHFLPSDRWWLRNRL